VLGDERGSASLEFVAIAIPLFIPLIILVGQVTAISTAKMEDLQIARTALRAFVDAPNSSIGEMRVREILSLSQSASQSSNKSASQSSNQSANPSANPSASQSTGLDFRIDCRYLPCIQPNNRVRLTLINSQTQNEVVVSLATGKWIEGEAGYVPPAPPPNELDQGLNRLKELSDLINEIEEAIGGK
jgi:hypothetical protein